MKIGVYDPYLDTLGGGERYMLTLAECLSEKHEVSMLWDDKEILPKAREKFGMKLSKVRVLENIFSNGYTFFKRFFASGSFDTIVYLSDGSIPLINTQLILHFQFPVEWVEGQNLKTKIKLFRVKKIICNSEFTKSYIDKTFAVKSNVLYPPIETDKIKHVRKENIILHVGRFAGSGVEGEDYKKQGVMVDAFGEMVRQGLSGWKFVLVVSVKDEEMDRFKILEEKARKLPIEFVVNQKSEKVWDAYNRAKIYWHASGYHEDLEKHPERAEHFGISTGEAMACGVVPVVINAGGQREIVTDSENGLVWDTLHELQEKTKILIEDPILLEKLSNVARESILRFDMKHFCEGASSLV